MVSLESKVHACIRCKPKFSEIMPFPPVYSFGDPTSKPVILIGLNPSRKEFEEKNGKQFLSTSDNPEDRRLSQMTYFKRETHTYFEKVVPFFEGSVKKCLGWTEVPWEKVGVLDLVKCATVKVDGQWNKLSQRQKGYLIENCESYLIEQLRLYRPRVAIPYGVDVCKWFADYLNIQYKEYKTFEVIHEGIPIRGIFVPQRQGKHSVPEITWVQRALKRLI